MERPGLLGELQRYDHNASRVRLATFDYARHWSDGSDSRTVGRIVRACRLSEPPPCSLPPPPTSRRSAPSPPRLGARTHRPRSIRPPRDHALGIPEDCESASRRPRPGHAPRAAARRWRHTPDARGRRATRSPTLVAGAAPAVARHRLSERHREVAIAAWSPGRSGPRVSALLVDRTHVVDSDAETLCALAAAMESVDVLTHARWVAVLGREAVTRRFYRTLERLVGALADEARGHAPAARASRYRAAVRVAPAVPLLSRGQGMARRRPVVPRASLRRLPRRSRRVSAARAGAAVLRNAQHACAISRRQRRMRSAAFHFSTAGLFARSPLERAHSDLEFRDEELGPLSLRAARPLSLHCSRGKRRLVGGGGRSGDAGPRVRVAHGRARASQHGRVLHAARAGGASDRRGTVARDRPFTRRPNESSAAAATPESWRSSIDETRARLERLRLLDPACGSGAFLVHALERMASLLAALGDPRPLPELRRAVLTRSIFGVDINPTAVWLCQLRLWLSIVIESTGARSVARSPAA